MDKSPKREVRLVSEGFSAGDDTWALYLKKDDGSFSRIGAHRSLKWACREVMQDGDIVHGVFFDKQHLE